MTFIYSKCVKSTVNGLERSPEGAEGEPSNRRRNLFIAYLCQLVVIITLEITFFASLMMHLFYPRTFRHTFHVLCVTEHNLPTSSTVLMTKQVIKLSGSR